MTLPPMFAASFAFRGIQSLEVIHSLHAHIPPVVEDGDGVIRVTGAIEACAPNSLNDDIQIHRPIPLFPRMPMLDSFVSVYLLACVTQPLFFLICPYLWIASRMRARIVFFVYICTLYLYLGAFLLVLGSFSARFLSFLLVLGAFYCCSCSLCPFCTISRPLFALCDRIRHVRGIVILPAQKVNENNFIFSTLNHARSLKALEGWL